MKKRHAGLNHIYRLIWNETLNAWVAVAETAKGRGQRASGRKLLAAWLALLPAAIMAAPEGGVITAGSGSIANSPTATTITQQTPKISIDWNRFSVGVNESVHFNQPSSSSIALNRVTGQDASQILGKISANGQLFILNPHGVLFGKGAQVDVGGLVASTLKLGNADFEAGRYNFDSLSNTGSVINQGTLTAKEGGYIALLAPEVRNEGVIMARLGTATLAAGNAVTLTLNNRSLLGYTIDKGALQALAENQLLIQADGGQVFMGAKAADQLSKAVVNNTGIIEAQTVQNKAGVIKLMGDMDTGSVKVDGTLDASAPAGGNGGFIETSAAHVSIADSVKITTAAPQGETGQWLVDPQDFTIAASGGDISGATLANQLATNNVTLSSTQGAANGHGDLYVNDGITWSSPHTLSLNAERDVNVNAYINNTGHGNLLIRADSTGTGTGTVNFDSDGSIALVGGTTDLYYNPTSYASPTNYSNKINGLNNNWMLVHNVNQLQAMNTNLTGKYALSQDIDASATSSWNGGSGFIPIGISYDNGFSGQLDGLEHTVNNIFINRPHTDNVGLFGYISSKNVQTNHLGLLPVGVQNIGFNGGSITGNQNVGTLAGQNRLPMKNVFSTINVTGKNIVGGLIGFHWHNIIDTAYTTGNITATSEGGSAGGIAGESDSGVIKNAYTTGNVTTSGVAGGIIGYNYIVGASLDNVYTTGNITGSYAGGLLGVSMYQTRISNAYVTGKITGTGNYSGAIIGAYFPQYSLLSSIYWDFDTTHQINAIGTSFGTPYYFDIAPINVTGFNSSQMKQQTNFTGFDFNEKWKIYEGSTAPLLKGFLKPLTITADSITKTYDGQSVSGGLMNAVYSNSNALMSGKVHGINTAYSDIKKAGTHTPRVWSDQQGYDINFTSGHLTINPANLALNNAAAGNKIYDGNANAVISGGVFSGLISGDDVSISSASFHDKNAGNNKSVVITLSGDDASNYNFTQPGLIANIEKASLAISIVTEDKLYDGTVSAMLTSLTDNRIAGDNLTITHSNNPSFDSKHAGMNKTVTLSDISVTGADVNNYHISETATTTANINKRYLSINATGHDKNYDGTAHATVTFSDNRLDGDVVSVDAAAKYFPSKAASPWENLIIVSDISLSGADADNYYFDQNIYTSGIIHKAILTIAASATNKVYDGTTEATIQTIHDNRINGDSIAVQYTHASFDTKNAAMHKTVTLDGISVTGDDANNYSVNTTAVTTADITARELNIQATAENKIYDATSAALVTLNDNRVSGDSLTVNHTTAAFDTKHAGVDKAVTVAGIHLTGTDANNYAVNTTATTIADITARALEAQASAQDKIYDATTGALITLSDNRISGDTLTINHANASFDTKHTGVDKVVTVTGINLTGTDANNYAVNTIATATSDITPRVLEIQATAQNKIYDGTVAATVATLTDNRITGDALTLVPDSASFETSSAGTGKNVTVAGISLSGTDAANYSAPVTVATTADINKAPLTITANDHSIPLPALPYSGGNGVVYSGFVNGEQEQVLGGMLTYTGSAQGATLTGKYSITPQGFSSSNYTLSYVDGTLNISQPTAYDAAIKHANTVSYIEPASNPSGSDDASEDALSKPKKPSETGSQPVIETTDSPAYLAKIVGCGMQLPADAAAVSCN